MPDIKRIDSNDDSFELALTRLYSSLGDTDDETSHAVRAILHEVRERGDEALLEFTNKFDQREAHRGDLEISREKIQLAAETIPDDIRQALEISASRIRQYHEKQLQESWSYQDEQGTLLGQRIRPLDSVGVYVPGAKAAYPSSVLMNIIPAKVAGVQEVIMVVPTPAGIMNNVVLAAAHIAGANRVFSIGGAQAVAALTYGTEMVPAVDKIVGPGNRFVAEAKRQVFGKVGIDMIAGPSEILIVSDGSSNPDWVAMDMFAQAEHDEDARSILVSTEAGLIDQVAASIEKLLPEMERATIIQTSLEKNGAFIQVENLDEAVEVINHIAPEHLELSVRDPEALLPSIRHAGAIFMGPYTAEALGDYCAGPNHVLPTARTARFSSPLGVYDFQKRSSLIMCSENSASSLAAIASPLARSEGLTAHARSAEYRLKT